MNIFQKLFGRSAATAPAHPKDQIFALLRDQLTAGMQQRVEVSIPAEAGLSCQLIMDKTMNGRNAGIQLVCKAPQMGFTLMRTVHAAPAGQLSEWLGLQASKEATQQLQEKMLRLLSALRPLALDVSGTEVTGQETRMDNICRAMAALQRIIRADIPCSAFIQVTTMRAYARCLHLSETDGALCTGIQMHMDASAQDSYPTMKLLKKLLAGGGSLMQDLPCKGREAQLAWLADAANAACIEAITGQAIRALDGFMPQDPFSLFGLMGSPVDCFTVDPAERIQAAGDVTDAGALADMARACMDKLAPGK